MNLYKIEFVMEGQTSKHHVSMQARNKVEAVTKAYKKLPGWREKDRVVTINITEDAGNQTSHVNYLPVSE